MTGSKRSELKLQFTSSPEYDSYMDLDISKDVWHTERAGSPDRVDLNDRIYDLLNKQTNTVKADVCLMRRVLAETPRSLPDLFISLSLKQADQGRTLLLWPEITSLHFTTWSSPDKLKTGFRNFWRVT